MADDKEYKVLEAVEIEGTDYTEGEVVSLTEEAAKPFLEAGKIELAQAGSEDEE